jgi:hypothetical protein
MSNVPKNQQDVLEFADLGDFEDGLLVMPKLWSVDKAGKYHWWQIKIGITFVDDDADPVSNEEDRIPVDQDEIERGDLDEDAIGVFWTEFAQDGGKVQDPSPTYIYEGKNIGRKNYTTPFTQAILEARKQYNLRIRRGNTPVREHLIKAGEFPSIDELISMTHRGDTPWRVFPMALHDVEKSNNWRHVQYPCDIQPKYDGTRFIVVQHSELPTQEINALPNVTEELPIDGYSRGLETYDGQEHILSEAMELLKDHPGLYLDGEIYKEGFSLQDISGTSRRQADSKRGAPELTLDYMIFDCFYTDKPDMTWSERRELLESLFATSETWTHLQMAPNTEVENREELNAIYRSYLDEGLEGAVIRNKDAPYEVGLSKEQRSYKVLKYKPRFDDEWPVIGYESGAKGKAVGAVVWRLAENDKGVRARLKLKPGDTLPDLSERLTFTSDMNLPFATRYAIYSYLEDTGDFEEKFYGKLMTVSYSILSNDKKPQQPKVLRFRDPTVQSTLIDSAAEY